MIANRIASNGTLHQRIVSDIEHGILSGDWAPGARIPSEHELARRYNCSRGTINKALTQLARAGYIERRRRAGSFVRKPQAHSAVLEVHTVESEVAALGEPYRYELIACRQMATEAPDRDTMGLPEGTPALAVTCLHHAGREPFCFEERLINLDAVPEAASASFASEAPGTWLLRTVPWNLAEHHISASGTNDETQRHLNLPDGSPCLVVERRTWNAERIVTWVRLTYPADRHALIARFAPSQSPASG